jgi:hypothetical protein
VADRFPETRYQMVRAGYTLVYSRPCSKCKATVDRWRTRSGREITMDHRESDSAIVQAHFKTCTVATHAQEQRDRQAEPLYKFAASTRAQAVVLVKNGEFRFEVDTLCDPADMHITLSKAADAVRDHLIHLNDKEPA